MKESRIAILWLVSARRRRFSLSTYCFWLRAQLGRKPARLKITLQLLLPANRFPTILTIRRTHRNREPGQL